MIHYEKGNNKSAGTKKPQILISILALGNKMALNNVFTDYIKFT